MYIFSPIPSGSANIEKLSYPIKNLLNVQSAGIAYNFQLDNSKVANVP